MNRVQKCVGQGKWLAVVVCGVVAGLCISQSASAERLPNLTGLDNRSWSKGVDRQEIRLLKRLPGPGARKTMSALKSRFVASGSAFALRGMSVETESARGLRADGADGAWSLLVRGDGTAARASNYAALATSPRRHPSKRFASDELEAMGRRFIGVELSDAVRLGANEELVALKTEHEVDAIGKGNTTLREEVVASTIVFGRRIDGIDVVGPGSKVSVTFDMRGAPVSFVYDWPEYQQTGQSQKVLPIEGIWERVNAHASARFQKDSVGVKQFACGYVDVGVRPKKRDAEALIQSGCYVQYEGSDVTAVAKGESASTKGTVDYIPVGESVAQDQGWPQAVAIRKHGDICLAPSVGKALFGVLPPPSAP